MRCGEVAKDEMLFRLRWSERAKNLPGLSAEHGQSYQMGSYHLGEGPGRHAWCAANILGVPQ